jgi:hypothetical protein
VSQLDYQCLTKGVSTVGKLPLRSCFNGKCQNGFCRCHNDENEVHNFCSQKEMIDTIKSTANHFNALNTIIENVEAEEDNYKHISDSDEEEEVNLFDEICANFQTSNDDMDDNIHRINVDIKRTDEISITTIINQITFEKLTFHI